MRSQRRNPTRSEGGGTSSLQLERARAAPSRKGEPPCQTSWLQRQLRPERSSGAANGIQDARGVQQQAQRYARLRAGGVRTDTELAAAGTTVVRCSGAAWKAVALARSMTNAMILHNIGADVEEANRRGRRELRELAEGAGANHPRRGTMRLHPVSHLADVDVCARSPSATLAQRDEPPNPEKASAW